MEKPFPKALSSAFGSCYVVLCYVMLCFLCYIILYHIISSLSTVHLHACDYHYRLFANGPTFYAAD